jgi:hypothetical protein
MTNCFVQTTGGLQVTVQGETILETAHTFYSYSSTPKLNIMSQLLQIISGC